MGEYNFDNLILLIGTNPLPNFVVADYFLKNNKNIQTIWFIHSDEKDFQKGTLEYAEYLEDVLKNNSANYKSKNFSFNKVSIQDVSDAANIRKCLGGIFKQELEKTSGFHFNYTGGTKSMSTHVYWFLMETVKVNYKSFSYLDARNFRIVDDDHGIIASQLRNTINIELANLISIHGFERKNEDSNDIFSEAVERFEELIAQNRIDDFYQDNGYDRKIFMNKNKEEYLAETVNHLDKEKVNSYRPNPAVVSVIESMPEEYRIYLDENTFNWEISRKKLGKTIEFLDGKWLEEHVYKTLEHKFNDNGQIKIYSNWEIRKEKWPDELYFELDVILIYGYQLIGISCTTDRKKGLCKSKGFEIIQRSRQIGGDEAKAIVITFLNDEMKETLQTELIYDTGGSKSNILVLGINDLKPKELATAVEDFLFKLKSKES